MINTKQWPRKPRKVSRRDTAPVVQARAKPLNYSVVVSGTRAVLDCCCLVSIEAIQTGWSPMLWARLKARFGDATGNWRKGCQDWLGSVSKFYIPTADDKPFDLHQTCMLLTKLTSPQHSCYRALAGMHVAPVSARIYDDEQKDRERHLLNMVSTFRQRFVHSSEALSAKEILAALLAMEEFSNLQMMAATGNHNYANHVSSNLSTGSQTGVRYALCISHDIIQALRMSVERICSSQALSNGRLGGIAIEVQLLLKVFAHNLLQYVAEVLEPLADYLHLNSRGKTARSTESRPSTNMENSSSLQSIYAGLKEVFKVLREKNGSEDERRIVNLYVDWLKGHSSPHVWSEFCNRQEHQLRQLVSFFEVLVGKNGLRHRLHHVHGGEGITLQYMHNCLDKAMKIQEVFANKRHAGLNTLEFHLQSFKQPTILSSVDVVFVIGNCQMVTQPSPEVEKHYLQLPRANLFGRSESIERILHLCRQPATAVVLTGESGMGKTALAVEVAHILREEFPQQYLLSGTSSSSLQAGLSSIGVLNRHTSSNQPQRFLGSWHSGAAHLAVTTGLLLVVDGLQNTSLLSQYMSKECLQNHTLIFTVSSSDVARKLQSLIANCHVHHLEPLSPGTSAEYLLSMCPKLRSAKSFFDTITQGPKAWLFLEQKTHCCPLTVQLLAKLLQNQDKASNHDVAGRFCSQQITLAEIQEGFGDNRFHRGVVATVRLLQETLSSHAKLCLLALSFLSRATHSIRYDQFVEVCCTKFSSTDGEVGAWANEAPIVFQQSCQELIKAGLMSSIAPGEVSIPLLIQKASIELALCDQESLSGLGNQIGRHLALSVEHYFRQRLQETRSLDASGSKVSEELTLFLPIAESILATASSVHCQIRVRIMVWLARCTFSVLKDWDTSLQHYNCALEVVKKDDATHHMESVMMLTAEKGVVKLKLGCFEEGTQLLNSARTHLSSLDNECLQDPFGLWWLKREEVISQVNRALLPGLLGSNDWHMNLPYIQSAMFQCASAGNHGDRASIPLPIGPLSKDGLEIVSPAMSPTGHFWQGVATWMDGKCEAGLHTMLEAALDLHSPDVHGGILPPESLRMVCAIFVLSESLSTKEEFEFYSQVSWTLGELRVVTWLSTLPPEPNAHKVPKSLMKDTQMMHLFYKRAVAVGTNLLTSFAKPVANIASAFQAYFQQAHNAEKSFLCFFTLGLLEMEGITACILRFITGIIRWHVHPDNVQAVIDFFRAGVCQRLEHSWKRLQCSKFAEGLSHFQENCDMEKIRSNPAYRYIMSVVINNHARVAIWQTSPQPETADLKSKEEADELNVEKMYSYVSALEEDAQAAAFAGGTSGDKPRGKLRGRLNMVDIVQYVVDGIHLPDRCESQLNESESADTTSPVMLPQTSELCPTRVRSITEGVFQLQYCVNSKCQAKQHQGSWSAVRNSFLPFTCSNEPDERAYMACAALMEYGVSVEPCCLQGVAQDYGLHSANDIVEVVLNQLFAEQSNLKMMNTKDALCCGRESYD